MENDIRHQHLKQANDVYSQYTAINANNTTNYWGTKKVFFGADRNHWLSASYTLS